MKLSQVSFYQHRRQVPFFCLVPFFYTTGRHTFSLDIFLHRKPYSRCQVKHYYSLKPLSPCQQKRTWRKKHKFRGLYQTTTVCITRAKSAICYRRSRLTSCRLSCRLITSTCEDFSCVCCWHWWPLCKVWRQRNDRITRLLSAYKGKWRDTHTPA